MSQEQLRADDLPSVLRALSVRKKHGVLTVSAGRERFDIFLSGGRITGCERHGESLTTAVLGKLNHAGCELGFDCDEQLPFDELLEQSGPDRELLQRARGACELELLHSLRHIERPKISFTPKIVTPDENGVLSITPGQFLLDLVEIDSDEERFRETFFSEEGEELEIDSLADEPPPGSRVVHEVWRNCRESQAVSEVLRKTLLTTHETCAALLALYDQHALTLKRTARPDGVKLDVSGFLGALEEEFGEFEDELGEESGDESGEETVQEAPDPVVALEESPASAPQSFRERWFELNCRLQEEGGRQMAGAVSAFVVLVVVGIFLPNQLQGLFDSLSAVSDSFAQFRLTLGL